MPRYHLELDEELPLTAADAFARLGDHVELGRVLRAPIRRVRRGDVHVNGVGSVRRIGVGLLALEETVTEIEPDRRIVYRITRGGGPLRDHRGELTFTDLGARSRVRWHIEYTAPRIVGGVLRLGLRAAIGSALRRLR